MELIHFMPTTVGRALLIVVGVVAGGGRMTLSVIGPVPQLAGVLNVFLPAPIVVQPIKGH